MAIFSLHQPWSLALASHLSAAAWHCLSNIDVINIIGENYMFQTHDTKHILAAKLTGALLLGSIIWVGLLVASAKQLASSANTNTYDVKIGPLVLNTLTRHEQNHGSVVSLTFENGLIWYFGFFIGTAICWQLLYVLIIRHRTMQL